MHRQSHHESPKGPSCAGWRHHYDLAVRAGADLIISHAGAGSVFEAMALCKPVITVPNAILMHNHQV